jgi:hypothetical protein
VKLRTVQSKYHENEREFHRKYSEWFRSPEIRAAMTARDKILLENYTMTKQQRLNPDVKLELKTVPPLPEYSPELNAISKRRSVYSNEIRYLRKQQYPMEKEINSAKALLTPYKYTISHNGLVRATDEVGAPRVKTEKQFIHKWLNLLSMENILVVIIQILMVNTNMYKKVFIIFRIISSWHSILK